jgi:hypothetical protein
MMITIIRRCLHCITTIVNDHDLIIVLNMNERKGKLCCNFIRSDCLYALLDVRNSRIASSVINVSITPVSVLTEAGITMVTRFPAVGCSDPILLSQINVFDLLDLLVDAA